MNCRIRVLEALTAMAALAGCGSIADKRTPEKISTIEVGKSTKANVINILGLPNESTKATLEDGRTADCRIYYRWADRSTAIIPTRYGNFAQSATRRGKPRSDHAATLFFSGEGIVIDVVVPEKENP